MPAPPQPWPTGEIERLEPLVARVLAPNPSPFTYTGTQTYLVGGPEGMAVIDPGPLDEAHLDALTAAIGEAPRTLLVAESDPATPSARNKGAEITGSRAAFEKNQTNQTLWTSAPGLTSG